MSALLVSYGNALASGAWMTLWLSAATILFGTLFGICLALLAASSPSMQFAVRAVIYIVMSLPALVVLVWLFYALPLIDPRFALTPALASIVALGLSLSAFVADILFSGWQRIPRGQIEVARVMFPNRIAVLRHVLAPLTLRTVGIPLLGQYLTTLKYTTLASVIGVAELLHVGSDIIQRTYRPLEAYSAVAVCFVILVLPLNLAARWVEEAAFPERAVR